MIRFGMTRWKYKQILFVVYDLGGIRDTLESHTIV